MRSRERDPVICASLSLIVIEVVRDGPLFANLVACTCLKFREKNICEDSPYVCDARF